MPYSSVLLGIAGLIPFIGLVLAGWFSWLPLSEAARYFTQYSAVLLSFFGGIHWFDAVSNQRTNHQIYVAMLPTIVGWLCLVFAGDIRVLGALSLAYLAVLFYDKFTLAMPKGLLMSYIALRVGLTTVVVVCHALMISLLT